MAYSTQPLMPIAWPAKDRSIGLGALLGLVCNPALAMAITVLLVSSQYLTQPAISVSQIQEILGLALIVGIGAFVIGGPGGLILGAFLAWLMRWLIQSKFCLSRGGYSVMGIIIGGVFGAVNGGALVYLLANDPEPYTWQVVIGYGLVVGLITGGLITNTVWREQRRCHPRFFQATSQRLKRQADSVLCN